MKKSIDLFAWNDGQASQRRASTLRQTQAARMLQEDPAPSHTAYGMTAPAALHAQPKSPENSGVGMRSETAVHRCLTEASAIEGDHRQAFPQVNPGVVGLAGLEPAASSLSEIDGQALCYPAFSLVVLVRKSYKDGVNLLSAADRGRTRLPDR
jgi:hypothetical protein